MTLRRLLFVLFACLVTGCATPVDIYKQSISAENYRKKLTIVKRDMSFFLADYVGTEDDCFPKISGRRCRMGVNKNLYRVTSELKMDVFELQIKNGGYDASKIKDFAFLAASDLAISNGYKYLTLTRSGESNACSSSYEAMTSGSVIGNVYSGSTVLLEQQGCATSSYFNYLFFNDPKKLELGVFHIVNTGTWSGLGMEPFEALYFSTMKGLKYEDFNPTRTDVIGGTKVTAYWYTPSSAWKNFYNADGLSTDLRIKHNVNDVRPYLIVNEALTSKAKTSEDVIQKNKSTL